MLLEGSEFDGVHPFAVLFEGAHELRWVSEAAGLEPPDKSYGRPMREGLSIKSQETRKMFRRSPHGPS